MAAEVPVLTSNLSPLPEITNGAAALVDPLSIAEIHGALDRLLTSPALRAHMIHTLAELSISYFFDLVEVVFSVLRPRTFASHCWPV